MYCTKYLIDGSTILQRCSYKTIMWATFLPFFSRKWHIHSPKTFLYQKSKWPWKKGHPFQTYDMDMDRCDNHWQVIQTNKCSMHLVQSTNLHADISSNCFTSYCQLYVSSDLSSEAQVVPNNMKFLLLCQLSHILRKLILANILQVKVRSNLSGAGELYHKMHSIKFLVRGILHFIDNLD